MALLLSPGAAYTGNMIRVLIIEGHPLVRKALEERLHDAVGLEVVGSSGQYAHAVRQAKVLRPQVILIESKAPGGLETLKSLREALPSAAVIVLTSYSDGQEEEEAFRLGAAAYLLKTLDTQALVERILVCAPTAAPTPA